MNYTTNKHYRLSNLKKKNYNNIYEPTRYSHCNCNCHCHKNITLNEIQNYNSEINSFSSYNYKNLNNNQIRNKSTNDLFSPQRKRLYTSNYKYSNFENKENKNLKKFTENNHKFQGNKKLNIIRTESTDNLAKSYVIYKNEIQLLNATKINKKEKSKSQNSHKKYFYGGEKLKIARNTNNHSYKEIIGRSGSRAKIFNKCHVINFVEKNDNNNSNINYDYRTNIPRISQNYETDISYELRNIKNDFNNNEANDINKNKKEIQKSLSQNYLLQYLNKNENDKNINNNFNGYNYRYCMNNCFELNKNDYFLNYCTDNNIKDRYITDNNLNEVNDNLNYQNNFRYYYNSKKNYMNNNRNLTKTNSLDNFKVFRYKKSNTTCNSKSNLLDDFNYEDFKLRVKLGLLKKQVYKNELIKNNKVRINTDLYYQDRKYIKNALNNNKNKKRAIEDILLEKTKKLLEEKKLRNNNKNINQKKKLNIKNENKILSTIKKNLIENNKRNNNKYVINPKLNFFKS